MTAAKLDIEIEQGADFALQCALEDASGNPIDITGCAFTAKLRTKTSDPTPGPVFTVTPIVPTTVGQLWLTMSATTTSGITVNDSEDAERQDTPYAWDLFCTWSNGTVSRLLYGVANVSPRASW